MHGYCIEKYVHLQGDENTSQEEGDSEEDVTVTLFIMIYIQSERHQCLQILKFLPWPCSFKAWAQMCLFVVWDYLTEEEKPVWLCMSKVMKFFPFTS